MRRALLLLAGVAILGSACATRVTPTSDGGTIPPGSRGTKEVTVYPSDSGKTITVVEGQTLVFERDPKETGPRPVSYEVGSVPDFLTFESGEGATAEPTGQEQPPFHFDVHFAGRGDLIIIQSLCPPSQADDPMPCPVVGPGRGPIGQIVIHVRAQGRGI